MKSLLKAMIVFLAFGYFSPLSATNHQDYFLLETNDGSSHHVEYTDFHSLDNLSPKFLSQSFNSQDYSSVSFNCFEALFTDFRRAVLSIRPDLLHKHPELLLGVDMVVLNTNSHRCDIETNSAVQAHLFSKDALYTLNTEESLENILKKLNELKSQEILDNNWTIKNGTLVFTGDMTLEEKYPLDKLCVFFKLFAANPGKVVLLSDPNHPAFKYSELVSRSAIKKSYHSEKIIKILNLFSSITPVLHFSGQNLHCAIKNDTRGRCKYLSTYACYAGFGLICVGGLAGVIYAFTTIDIDPCDYKYLDDDEAYYNCTHS